MERTAILTSALLVIAIASVSSDSPNTCTLPVVQGRCDAVVQRFAFHADTGECREFVYGGCGANANNFASLDDCKTACPSTRATREAEEATKEDTATIAPAADCAAVTCSGNSYMAHYRELNCEPVFGEDNKCCPIRFDCSKRDEQKTDKCYHDGKEYNVDDELPDDTTPPCLVNCRCTQNAFDKAARVSCVSIECPELFMGPLTEPNCVRQYTPNTCCSTSKYCTPENTTLADAEGVAKCEFDGNTYIEGQKFYPAEEPCMTCLCQPGFTGKLEAPHCKVSRCNLELHYSHYLRRKCVPVYYEERCCPIDWRCPDDFNATAEVNTPTEKTADIKSDTECVFGNLRYNIGDSLPSGIAGDCVKCSCSVPPVPTCVKNYSSCSPRAGDVASRR